MRVFWFIFRKMLRPTVLLTAGLTLMGLVFLLLIYRGRYGDGADFEQALAGLTTAQEAYSHAVSAGNELSEHDREILDRADRYMNVHNKGGVPGILPNSLVDEIYEVRYGEHGTESAGNTLALLSEQLYAQSVSRELITQRMEGYSRNMRRGVTDEFSLKTAELMSEKYSEVTRRQDQWSAIYDTRAADNFADFMSGELISFIGVFLMTFSAFSAELQSRRFSAFSITAVGAKKYTLSRLTAGLAQIFMFFTVFYFAGTLTVGWDERSMPVQYLRGYELSHLPMSLGGFMIYAYLLKLTYLLTIGLVSMLISMVTGRVILSAVGSAAVIALSKAAARLPGALGHVMSCDILGMSGDINVVNVFGSPVLEGSVFFAVMGVTAAVCFVLTATLSERRGRLA